jgi:hypothetical protein
MYDKIKKYIEQLKKKCTKLWTDFQKWSKKRYGTSKKSKKS